MTPDELRLQQAIADAGDKLAQYKVAMHHKSSHQSYYGYNSDFEKYIKLSAEQGYVEAQFEYAAFLEQRSSSDDNTIDVIKFYYGAAVQNHSKAIEKLEVNTTLYRKLEVLSRQNSYHHYSNQASSQTRANYWLGKLYASDFFQQKNTEKAIGFYQKALEKKYPLAANELARIYYNGRGVNKDVTKAIALLKPICEEDRYHNSSSTNDFTDSHYLLGTMYHWSDVPNKDIDKAISAYEKAERQGHVGASLQLGHIYRSKARNTRKESSYRASEYKDKAIRYYKKNDGDSEVQNSIGLVYHEAGDYRSAVEWFEKSANQGLVIAQRNLATTYDPNHFGVGNESKALYWYRKAAENGNADAQFNLAEKYISGVAGVLEKDEKKSKHWYREAAEQDHEKAHKKLLLIDINKQGKDDFNDNQEVLEKYFAFEKALGYWFSSPYEMFNALDRRADPKSKEAYFESYEFLGDGVLGLAVRNYLFANKTSEMRVEDLSKIYDDMVKNKGPLLEMAKKFGLEALIIRNPNEGQHAITDKMLVDHMEAQFGAVLNDNDGDNEEVDKLVVRLWKPYLDAELNKVKAAAAARSTVSQAATTNTRPVTSPASVMMPPSHVPQPQTIQAKRSMSAGSLAFYNQALSLSVEQVEAKLKSHPHRANACCNGGKQLSVLALVLQQLKAATKDGARNEKIVGKLSSKVKLLTQYGASWSMSDKKGNTPQDIYKKLDAGIQSRLASR